MPPKKNNNSNVKIIYDAPPKKSQKIITQLESSVLKDFDETLVNRKQSGPLDISKKINKKNIQDFGTDVDEDDNVDTDFNEELEDEYEEGIDDEAEKEEDNLDDVQYLSDEVADEIEGLEENEVEANEVPEDEVVEGTVGDDDGCLYNFNVKKNDFDSDDEYDEEVFDDDEQDEQDDPDNKFVHQDDRITGDVMTKYERVRILAERSKQLMLGAKPMLKNTDNIHPKDIARLEMDKGYIPYKIHRERPDGKIEVWKLNELRIIN